MTRAAMDFLFEVGLEPIGAWTRVLSQALTDGGEARGVGDPGDDGSGEEGPHHSLFSSRRLPCGGGSPEGEGDRGPSARGPALRLAPHFYSTLDDVERALDALAEVLRR